MIIIDIIVAILCLIAMVKMKSFADYLAKKYKEKIQREIDSDGNY